MEVKGEEIVRSILNEVIYKVYSYCTTEYSHSVPKEQKNMPPALLGASDDKIDLIAKRDFYAEQQITMKKIYRRVARETVRDLIILAAKQAAASPDNGQLVKTSQFRFANYDQQKSAYMYQQRMDNKKVKIHKKLQVKVTIGSEIVQYTLRSPVSRANVAEGNMEIEKSYEAQREITPKALYKAAEKTTDDPMTRTSPDCNIPGPVIHVVDIHEHIPANVQSEADASHKTEDDPEPKGWRKLLCCGNPQKKQAKEKRKKLGLLNRLRRFFARR
ncbi:uncharacterized protein LOC134273051 isoform X2 [Saccostrea cucullata]|uniref:uncharacterized protein LOC134273051 isoform X2 n=1 Tax=Saccostrea cuccullata TaxID=36930 RepID=UPI002ED55CB5